MEQTVHRILAEQNHPVAAHLQPCCHLKAHVNNSNPSGLRASLTSLIWDAASPLHPTPFQLTHRACGVLICSTARCASSTAATSSPAATPPALPPCCSSPASPASPANPASPACPALCCCVCAAGCWKPCVGLWPAVLVLAAGEGRGACSAAGGSGGLS